MKNSVRNPLLGLTHQLSRAEEWLGSLPVFRRIAGGDETQAAVAIAQGIVASIMVTLGSWSVGWLATAQNSLFARTTFLNPLRVEPVGVILCACLMALGSLILVRAWLRLGQRSGVDHQYSVPVIRRAILWWSVPLSLSFPIFSRDVYSYFAQGRLLHAGLNPYENWVSQLPGWFAEGSDGLWAESASPYGPIFLLFAQFVFWISAGIPEIGVILFRLFALAGVALCVWAIPPLAALLKSSPGWALWISVANPLFLLIMIPGVHNDSFMMGAILLAFLYGLRRRRWASVVWAIIAIGIKPIVLIGLPFLGLLFAGQGASWKNRFTEWALLALAVGLGLAAVGGATGLWFGWIPGMASSGSAAFPFAPIGLLGQGIGWVFSLFGGDQAVVAGVFYTLCRVLAVLFILYLALFRTDLHPMLGFALGLSAVVLLAPIIQPWYLLWIVPLFATYRVYRGLLEELFFLLSAILVLVGVVDQLSVAQWIDLTLVRIITSVLGLLYLAYLLFVDPKTKQLFPFNRASWTQARVSATELRS